MTVVVSKGLITRASQGQSDALRNQSLGQAEAHSQISRNAESSKAAVATNAAAKASSDAVITNVRSLRAERTDGKVRVLKEASELADNLGQRIQDGEDGRGEKAHAGLDPVSSSGHLK